MAMNHHLPRNGLRRHYGILQEHVKSIAGDLYDLLRTPLKSNSVSELFESTTNISS